MIGLAKLGVAVWAGYYLGGRLGSFVGFKVGAVSEDSQMGARWAGRAVTFVGVGLLLSKV